jgi:hypothetical protein
MATVKKAWTAPTLIVHGTVKEITLGCDKMFGSSDGFTFGGNAIMCRS